MYIPYTVKDEFQDVGEMYSFMEALKTLAKESACACSFDDLLRDVMFTAVTPFESEHFGINGTLREFRTMGMPMRWAYRIDGYCCGMNEASFIKKGIFTPCYSKVNCYIKKDGRAWTDQIIDCKYDLMNAE